MARDAVRKISDSFFFVLRRDIGWRVLVASETRIDLEIAVGVTSRARGVVVAIKREKLIVLKCRGLPMIHLMALVAACAQVFMEVIGGGGMAGLAVLQCGWAQLRMGELFLVLFLMVGMTRGAIRLV